MAEYDLVVIGSGPGGQKAAIAAAKLGKHVAIVERHELVGGVCLNQGTIPSKTLREAVLYLAGTRQREIYGYAYRVKEKITMDDLMFRCHKVIQNEIQVVRDQLQRNDVEVVLGAGCFVDPNRIMVTATDSMRVLEADKIVIAVGTKPARPKGIEFNDSTVVDSDGLLNLKVLPKSAAVVGAGIIGVEYASMFQALGVRMTLVDGRKVPLEFLDREIEETLMFYLRDEGMVQRFGEKVARVQPVNGRVRMVMESGKELSTDFVMFAAGRVGAIEGLNLAAVGIEADDRGRIKVDQNFRTSVEGIYAVGDVIGFPMLASFVEEGFEDAFADGADLDEGDLPRRGRGPILP